MTTQVLSVLRPNACARPSDRSATRPVSKSRPSIRGTSHCARVVCRVCYLNQRRVQLQKTYRGDAIVPPASNIFCLRIEALSQSGRAGRLCRQEKVRICRDVSRLEQRRPSSTPTPGSSGPPKIDIGPFSVIALDAPAGSGSKKVASTVKVPLLSFTAVTMSAPLSWKPWIASIKFASCVKISIRVGISHPLCFDNVQLISPRLCASVAR